MVDFERNRRRRYNFKRKSLSEKPTEELKKPIYLNSETDPTDIFDVGELASRSIHNHSAFLKASSEIHSKMKECGFIIYEDVEEIIQKHKYSHN